MSVLDNPFSSPRWKRSEAFMMIPFADSSTRTLVGSLYSVAVKVGAFPLG
jgi:hypothetical protein